MEGAFALTSTAPLRVLAKITCERASIKSGQHRPTKFHQDHDQINVLRERETDLQISPHSSPLPSSDFSPYVDVSQVQLRLADSHWCWFWGLCRNNAYEHSAKPVCANSIWMWGTWWIRMAHCGKFQQTHDIWLLPRYPQSQSCKAQTFQIYC